MAIALNFAIYMKPTQYQANYILLVVYLGIEPQLKHSLHLIAIRGKRIRKDNTFQERAHWWASDAHPRE